MSTVPLRKELIWSGYYEDSSIDSDEYLPVTQTNHTLQPYTKPERGLQIRQRSLEPSIFNEWERSPWSYSYSPIHRINHQYLTTVSVAQFRRALLLGRLKGMALPFLVSLLIALSAIIPLMVLAR